MSFPASSIANLRGQRLRVAVAIAMTFGLVATDILTAFPLKFILDKVAHHQDPAFPSSAALLPASTARRPRRLIATEVHTQLGVIVFAGPCSSSSACSTR